MPIPMGFASTKTMTDIANTIRHRNGENRCCRPNGMADAICALEWLQSKAYAFLTYPESGANTQLLFVKALDESNPCRCMTERQYKRCKPTSRI